MDSSRTNRENRVLYKTCRKCLGIFLAAMLGLTVLSRFLDTVIVPRVTVDTAKKGTLRYQVKGSGMLESTEVLSVPVLTDITVRSVFAGTGQSVTGETPLFAYQLDELKKLYSQRERELKQQELALETERLSAQPLPGMLDEEIAQQELTMAERQLKRAQEKFAKAEQEYQKEIVFLTQEYEENLKKNLKELVKERKQAYETAEQEYELARLDKRLEVHNAALTYDEALAVLELLEDEDASEADRREAEWELEKAAYNKKIVEEKWELEVEKAEKAMDDAYDFWQALYNEEEDAQAALKKEYKQGLKEQEDELETVQEQLNTASDTCQEALTALENARKKDNYARQGENRNLEIAVLKQKSMELDIEDKAQELKNLKSLIEQDGFVYTPYPGLLTKIELTGDSRRVLIGSGNIMLKAELDSEQAQNLTKEAAVSLQQNGRNLSCDAVIRSLETDQEKGCVYLTADLENTELLPGAAVDLICESESPVYERTVPIDALHQDDKGTYVLQIQERDTIMGRQQVAVRLNVTVLAKTTEKAAIEGSLGLSDQIIVGSIKQIEAGSRIRVVSE